MMHKLNLPEFPLRMIKQSGKICVFDIFRKQFVLLTPEEWVRQHFLWWLKEYKGYPPSLIAVEASLKYNRMLLRADAIIYDKTTKPLMIIECKSAEQKITQDVFDQVARYNFPYGVSYLAVTNGLDHYCCKMDKDANEWVFLREIPDYMQMLDEKQ